jgi:hypothetical protein
MKNSIIALLISGFTLMACSKSSVDDNSNSNNSRTATVIPFSNVPEAVRNSFNSSYNGATEIEWLRGSSKFICQFNLSGQRHDARFDDNGHHSSHSVISLNAVPAAVLDAFRQRFPSDNVYEWKLRNDGTWKAHFMRGSVKYEATYSADGTLLKFEQSS